MLTVLRGVGVDVVVVLSFVTSLSPSNHQAGSGVDRERGGAFGEGGAVSKQGSQQAINGATHSGSVARRTQGV